MLELISSTFPGQLYPMYAEKIAKNQFQLSPSMPGARVEGENGTLSAILLTYTLLAPVRALPVHVTDTVWLAGCKNWHTEFECSKTML